MLEAFFLFLTLAAILSFKDISRFNYGGNFVWQS